MRTGPNPTSVQKRKSAHRDRHESREDDVKTQKNAICKPRCPRLPEARRGMNRFYFSALRRNQAC